MKKHTATYKKGYEMGRKAFKEGKHSAPALSAEFMAEVKAGTDIMELGKGYNKGWMNENLK